MRRGSLIRRKNTCRMSLTRRLQVVVSLNGDVERVVAVAGGM